MLRLLINQRLTAAAEEIFAVFGRTIAEYEEEISRSKLEIDRQRRLLDLSRTPQISVQANSSGEELFQDPKEAALCRLNAPRAARYKHQGAGEAVEKPFISLNNVIKAINSTY